jgi:glycine cleavage system regulatory protein
MPNTTFIHDGSLPEPTPKSPEAAPVAGRFTPGMFTLIPGTLHEEGADPRLGVTAIWLDPGHHRMTISCTGIDHSGLVAHVTERLKSRGINIESAFGARLTRSSGTFFEIAGEPATMQELYDEITHGPLDAPPEGDAPSGGIACELEVIAPDRSGILYDIARRLDECRIGIAQMVIQTRATSQGRRGIVYARLEAPSERARDDFAAKLRDIEDFPRWKCRYDIRDRGPRPERAAGDGMACPN